MAQVLFRNALGSEAAPAIALPRRRVRLSTVMRRHVPEGFRAGQRPVLVSVHRANDPIAVRNETVRLREEWSTTTVGVRDVVVITLLPQGGGGGNQFKMIGAALASVALTALAGPIGTAVSGALFAGSALAAQIISAGVMVGGSFLLSLAARPKANKEDQTGPYGVTGGGVLPRPGERIPSVYGRTCVEPDLSQPDYMIYEGNEQVLFKRMTIGLGKYTIHTIRTGDSVMWTAAGGVQAAFQGLEIDIINPGETTTLVPSNVLSSSQVNGNELQRPGDNPEWTGPFVLGAPDQTYTKIQIDWSAPRGVYWRDGNGRIRTAYVKCRWEYAPVDADGNPTAAWQTLLAFNDGYASDKPIRRSHIITVPNGRYAVRAKNEREEANDTWTDSVNWDGLRAPMNDNTVRPRVTEIAMKIKAGPELGIASFSDILVDVSRILPVWNGTAWVEQATRKAVWAWVDILRNTDYGAALSTNVIDVAKALSYATAITEFDTFDGVIRGPVSVWEAASTVLFPLRAEPTFLGSIWSFTRDEPTAMRRTLFTRRQIVRGTTRQEWGLSTQDGAADVIVSYNAAGDPKRPRESRHTIGAQSLTPRRIELPGVTDNRHAKHIAIWLSAIAAYRRKSISFETEMDGRILTRGTPFGAEVWFEGSQAVGVRSYSGAGNRTLTLTADVSLASGDFIMLRDKRGRAWGPVQATASTPRVIVLDATDVTNVVAATGQSLTDVLESDGDMPSLMIRTGSTVAQDWLCQSVEPSGRDRVAIRGVLASNDVWTALGVTIPSIPNLPGPPTIPTQPALVWIRADARQHTSSLEVAWSTSVVPGIRQVQVQISYDGTEYADIYKGTAFEGTAPLRMSNDPVTVRARGFGARNVPSAWVSTTFTTGTATIPGPSIPPGIIDIDKLDPILGGLLNSNNPGSLPWAQAQINAGNKRLDEVGKDIENVVKASDRQFAFDIETLAQTLAALQSRFEELRTANIEAGLEINSVEGRARISAIAILASDTARQFNTVSLELSSLDARISAIASVVIDGDLDGLIDQITTVGLELDALAASLNLYATKSELDAQTARINQAEIDIDANTAAIALKAAQTVVDTLTTRLNTAELQISAQDGIIANVQAQLGTDEIDLVGKTLAEILDLLSKNQNFQVEKVARATSGLNAQITAQGEVIATQRTELLALNDETRAIVVQESTARASADAALATSITALQATVNDPTTGLPATRAELQDERTTRATRDAAITEAFLGLRSTLSRRAAVTINNTAPGSPAENDLWVRPDLSHQVFRRVGGSWVFVTGGAAYTFTRANAMPGTPAALHIWADQDDADRLYEWGGNTWADLTSPVIAASAQGFDALTATVTQQGSDITSIAGQVTGLQSTINQRTRVYTQAAAPSGTAHNVNDLWFDTDDDNRQYRWTGTAWVNVGTSAAPTFVQPSAPTTSFIGALWIDSDDGNRLYRWNGSQWVDITDARTLANASAITALQTQVTQIGNDVTSLSSAVTQVNSQLAARTRTYVQASTPTVPAGGHAVNDQWYDSDDEFRLRYWDGSAWALVTNNLTPTYFQPNAPTTTVPGAVWFDTDDTNKMYRWSGTAWVLASDTRIAANATAVSNLTTSVNSINGQVTALSQSLTSVQTQVDQASAEGQFRVIAVSAAAGAVSSIEGRVRAANGAWVASAAFRMDAIAQSGVYTSQIVFRADRFFFQTGTGRTPVFAASSAGVWIDAPLWVGGADETILIDGSSAGPRIIGYGP